MHSSMLQRSMTPVALALEQALAGNETTSSIFEIVAPFGILYPIGRNKAPLGRGTAKLSCWWKIRRWLVNPLITGIGLRIDWTDSLALVVFDCESKHKHGTLNPGPDGISMFEDFCQEQVSACQITLSSGRHLEAGIISSGEEHPGELQLR